MGPQPYHRATSRLSAKQKANGEPVKGTIPKCLEEMVRAKHGEVAWTKVKTQGGLARWHTFLTTEDIDDEVVKKLFVTTAEALRSTVQVVMDDFGMHWSTVYAPDIYGVFFRRAANARELLLSMSEVHRITTDRVPNSAPPRFEYRWVDDDTLVMTYRSDRNLAALMPGLIRGVGVYYKERLRVTADGDEMTVRFLGDA